MWKKKSISKWKYIPFVSIEEAQPCLGYLTAVLWKLKCRSVLCEFLQLKYPVANKMCEFKHHHLTINTPT